ncbi:AcrR family transcriptional regulator [Plantactinospora soyae]|uniref:AcrR family transcriptional regulator n=1 Tax=Plantactinospora soyae TaxID=1544732 RepID=A0A927MAC3_9ACTN|nr:AcrR family transcriptional regulator [Plantactinospora soyae]
MPSRPSPHQPRKTPQQQRARQTRQRILDAAARVFTEYGYAAGTTDRIAEAAKLSVGSVYQYFPNKDSILLTLTLAHIDEGIEAVRASLTAVATSPVRPEQWLPAMVGAYADLHSHNPRLHKVLFEESPRPPELLDRFHQAERDAADAVEQFLRSDPSLDLADPTRSARVVVAVIESLVHRFVSQRPDDVDSPHLTSEIVDLLVAYLRAERV